MTNHAVIARRRSRRGDPESLHCRGPSGLAVTGKQPAQDETVRASMGADDDDLPDEDDMESPEELD